MANLGFDLGKDNIFWCALDGARGAPVYVAHGVENYRVDDYREDLIVKSGAIFLRLINRIKPIKVAYRLSLDAASSDQIAYLHFPIATLISVCRQAKVPSSEFYTRSFTHKLFGLDKSESKEDACDRLIGEHAPNWKRIRNATLACWASLDV
ncbi:hypothetical protein [Mesorhizobium sp. NFR06]|uniref:hypothetical protein n=1 Tax=Mesorhizobium sp. NFR06 TaxID=1566290 RepID=UPI00122D5901|nr:hypothetical protein [Mesorhizobium sp. NFR06]